MNSVREERILAMMVFGGVDRWDGKYPLLNPLRTSGSSLQQFPWANIESMELPA